MYKTYKIRLFPTEEQERMFIIFSGACRFIWNYTLNYQFDLYKNEKKHLYGLKSLKIISELKKNEDYEWLNKISSYTLQCILKDLEQSFKMFFKSNYRLPKFKKKKNNDFHFPSRPDRLYFKNGCVHLEKIGHIKYKTNYNLSIHNKFYNPRIKYINKKWILFIGVDVEKQDVTLNEYNAGIDVGIKDFAIISCNDNIIRFKNINKAKEIKRLESKLKHIQRNISRKYRTNKSYEKTNNIIKLENNVAEIYYHLQNIRLNYIYKVTNDIIRLLPKNIIVEDLNILGLVKNKHLSKSILDSKWGKFFYILNYKCNFYGINFIKADGFYPSSKTCSHCHAIKKDLKLKDRTYICKKCGLVIDRDENAAINLMNYIQ